mmetsp:Transcript_47911/g.35123  ORF Transcript_47911/g.35123 Transcript_47911/m.35123 type:complete len:151 (-) Transcript_47911:265-717(-)|eukprot:CAMPEP_0202960840 /NCGR_PEP_ID=MMETSP1396-20130829/4992_1 /ASSEMBLY_ACC=CAM_ASM_000872 /TAXON_ID= /ORGANISM="Pseudokeronopsis sp., Strain Brazil" /LENGTH=150 /DNA_ID=CAMNT_0049680327 /DNA_START=368 /DNA_END=820 /DNA_ORIENTATION=-
MASGNVVFLFFSIGEALLPISIKMVVLLKVLLLLSWILALHRVFQHLIFTNHILDLSFELVILEFEFLIQLQEVLDAVVVSHQVRGAFEAAFRTGCVLQDAVDLQVFVHHFVLHGLLAPIRAFEVQAVQYVLEEWRHLALHCLAVLAASI